MPRNKKQNGETPPPPALPPVLPPVPQPRATPTPASKQKRKPTAYAQFVKSHYDSVRSLPSKDCFKTIAQMWKEHKAKQAKQN